MGSQVIVRKQEARSQLLEAGKALSSYDPALSPSTEDLAILSLSARQIVDSIVKEKKWTAERVMLAFIRSAIRMHERSNALTEILFGPALEQARLLDAEFSNTLDCSFS